MRQGHINLVPFGMLFCWESSGEHCQAVDRSLSQAVAHLVHVAIISDAKGQ